MPEPHYNEAGEFIDLCFVCGINKCPIKHTRSERHYRKTKLMGKVLFKKHRTSISRELKSHEGFWGMPDSRATTPELMGYADHLLKGFIAENLKKEMPLEEAMQDAYARVRKLIKRNRDGLTNILTPRGWQKKEKTVEELHRKKWGYLAQ